ncbi:MAG: tetratricopeptide repeat protein [Planctomycetota bacterium]|jgi:tetratricopeptide (TPR) repeat protein
MRIRSSWLITLTLSAPMALADPAAQGPDGSTQVRLDPDGTSVEIEVVEDDTREITAAIAAGDLEGAYELLGAQLVQRYLADSRAALDRRDAAGAMSILDRALRIDARDAGLLLTRGEALLLLGEEGIVQGQQGLFTMSAFEDALKVYDKLRPTAASRLGMARAAYMLNRSDEAAGYAREANALLDAGSEPRNAPAGMDAAAVITESLYLSYADEARRMIERVPESDADREQALYAESLASLDQWLAIAPDDPRSWEVGVNLMLFRAAARDEAMARTDALSILENGLDRNPGDATLLARLTDVARGAGGLERSIEAWQRQLERNATDDARRTLAIERFELGMRDFPGADRPSEEYVRALERFDAAEQAFVEAERVPDAMAWRVICRLGRAWVHYWSGDLEQATAAFLSMEELAEGGLEYFLPERLSSGRLGLEYVVQGFMERNDLVSAAAVADVLHDRYPEDANLANNAGFLNRDAATGLENLGQAFCRAASGELDEETRTRLIAGVDVAEDADEASLRQAFAERSGELLELARAGMERSGAAYLDAARLSPGDVRIQNDTSLIFVYYLHRDLEAAEQRLLDAVALGTAQLENADELDEQARYALDNAWGDAHENLGVLALDHTGDLDAAERWFRRALEIGPDPRPIVSEFWLPRVEKRRAGEALEPSHVMAWGRPCQ